jgi:hypothetical protein
LAVVSFLRAIEMWQQVSAPTNAKQKSLELLLSFLDEGQRAQLELCGGFTVVGGHTGRKYWISAKIRNYNVSTENGQDVYCAGPAMVSFAPGQDIPIYDHLLGQLLGLRHLEEEFMLVANSKPAVQYAPTGLYEPVLP